MNDAVITGYGIVCALGANVDAFATGLAESRCGVADLPNPPDGAPKVAAFVKQALPNATRDRKVALALIAAREAWAQAREQEHTAALTIGIGLEQAHMDDFPSILDGHRIAWEKESPTRSEARFRSPVDLAADAVRNELGLQGRQFVHVSACAAGTMALGHAMQLIRRGRHDVVLAGATDSMLNPLGLVGMGRLGAPSPRAAQDACRPFDRRRDGLVMGEGAAMFVVESEARAKRRGARIFARILGFASTQDGYRVTAPRPDGARAAAAMREAVASAGLSPRAIDYLNAHGTGTPLNDIAEARAIRDVFQAHADWMPVSSIKGAIGHAMAAAGALEAAACITALNYGIVPGTLHCEQPDPECAIKVLSAKSHALSPRTIMSNSFGFGGQNACIILGAA